jgi:isocitrate/isopropylmalate dehydrogenase
LAGTRSPVCRRHDDLRVGSIPGVWIGSEVMGVTLPLLGRAAALDDLTIEASTFDWSAARDLAAGAMLPADAVDDVNGLDAAIGGRLVPGPGAQLALEVAVPAATPSGGSHVTRSSQQKAGAAR